MAIPYFQKLQKEGESGRKKINQITRYLTVFILIFQSPAYIANLVSQLPSEAIYPFSGAQLHHSVFSFFGISSIILLTAGSMFIMWLGERITDKGIGNGISIIIMIGIMARLPFALFGELVSRMEQKGGGMVLFVVEIAFLVFVILVTILLVQGTRRIPVQYAKRIVGNKQYGGVRQYIPLKVNAAGVMPIIFAQAIMFLPLTLAGFANSETLSGFARVFTDFNSWPYNLTFFLLIIVFTYFYTAITVNPNQMAEDMKKNGGFIPGVKPGKRTAEFIDNVMSRITLPGSIFLGFVAIMPAFVRLVGVNTQFAQFYGGTSLLILVGVVLDTLQQIESHLLMRHYDGLTKSGRIKGRSSYSVSG
jgi:preprotein translocase subunit SecY